MPGTCWLARDALNELLREARRWRLRETGGALLGWRSGEDTVVARVLGPGPDAGHGFRSFEPDGAWQNEQGAQIYSESGRTIAYLGDWHTHPRGPARPSRQDSDTAKIIATDQDFRTPTPLYAIAARRVRRRKRWELVMFEWHGDKLEVVPVRLFDLHSDGELSHLAAVKPARQDLKTRVVDLFGPVNEDEPPKRRLGS